MPTTITSTGVTTTTVTSTNVDATNLKNLTVPTASGTVVGSGANYPLNIDSSATANSIQVDSSGRVLKPNQTGVYMRRAAAGTVNYTSGNILAYYDNEVRDAGSDYSSNTFTAPVDGFYIVTVQFFSTTGTSGAADIIINGSTRIARVGREGNQNYYEGQTAGACVYLDASDYITIERTFGTVHMNGGYSHFGVALIG